MLADMAIGVEASRLCTYRSAWEADQGRKNSYYASIAKAMASEVANRSAADAVQVCRCIHQILQIFLCNNKTRGVARILEKGVLMYARAQILTTPTYEKERSKFKLSQRMRSECS